MEERQPELSEPIVDGLPFRWSEFEYSLRHERVFEWWICYEEESP